VGPRNHVLDGMRLGATWQIQWIDLHDSDAGCSYRYCSHVSFIFYRATHMPFSRHVRLKWKRFYGPLGIIMPFS